MTPKGNFFLTIVLITVSCAYAQEAVRHNSLEIYRDLQRLNFLGNALYVAAHPDDENQRIISYLANEMHARTGYLSMTRGGGGQNLIGPELKDLLGVLRTQELLEARGIDGGEQFFTRARDFGYSKHPDETFEFWNKEEVLSDVVHLIRYLRPDVVINRFDHRSPGSTHGHHTGSAILSTEAYELAADPNYQVPSGLGPWQVKQLYFNTSWWFYGSREGFEKADKSNLLSVDVGVFYPELGLSNNEIAAMARSMHKCQGFGQALQRGSQIEYLEYIKGTGDGTPKHLFEGIDTSWERLEGGQKIGSILNKVEEAFNFLDPSEHLPDLVRAYGLLEELSDSHWKRQKLPLLQEVIIECAGLYLNVFSESETAVPGGEVGIEAEFTVRSRAGIRLVSCAIPEMGVNQSIGEVLPPNSRKEYRWQGSIPKGFRVNSHYWLKSRPSEGRYSLDRQEELNHPQNPADFSAEVELELEGRRMRIKLPVLYRRVRPDEGESLRRFRVVPPVSGQPVPELILFPNRQSRDVELIFRSFTDSRDSIQVRLDAGADWQLQPSSLMLAPLNQGEQIRLNISITPPKVADRTELRITARFDGRDYGMEHAGISYGHIPYQMVLRPQSTSLIREDIELAKGTIGYIEGAGDGIDESLRALGIPVTAIDLDTLQQVSQLRPFRAVVMGIRAYNVETARLKIKQPILMDYVKDGGNLIVQYNTAGRWGAQFDGLGPYPFELSRRRVTDETAPVEITSSNSRVLNYPNRIEESDFDHWVQERGLYFPNQWAPEYQTLIQTRDSGEDHLKGGILHAAYGKGNYFYTSLSFFRQLPAGVPGAYRLFVNMLYAKPLIESND